MLNKKLDKILPKVQKPGRYVGGELNSVIKNKEDVDRTLCVLLSRYV